MGPASIKGMTIETAEITSTMVLTS